MSTLMFIIGFCIFSVYIFFTFWIIFDQNKKQREEGNGTKQYYDRNYSPDKAPKRKGGSQSRSKNYSRKFKEDVH